MDAAEHCIAKTSRFRVSEPLTSDESRSYCQVPSTNSNVSFERLKRFFSLRSFHLYSLLDPRSSSSSQRNPLPLLFKRRNYKLIHKMIDKLPTDRRKSDETLKYKCSDISEQSQVRIEDGKRNQKSRLWGSAAVERCRTSAEVILTPTRPLFP